MQRLLRTRAAFAAWVVAITLVSLTARAAEPEVEETDVAATDASDDGEATPTPAAPPPRIVKPTPPAAPPTEKAIDASLARDIQSPSPGGAGKPRALLVDTNDFRLALRGFGQFLAIPYTGKDALLANGDVGDFAGLRVRRLTLGAEGRAGRHLSFDMWMDLADGPVLTQARLAYTFLPEVTVEAGVVRVPFSKSAIQSSAEVMFTERPLSVERLVPDRQPGIAVYGAFLGGLASYRAGVFNGAAVNRMGLGNDHPGMLYAGRIALSPLGALRPGQSDLQRGPIRVELAGNAFYDQAAAFDAMAYGGDLSFQGYGASLLVEYIAQSRTPRSQPIVSPALNDKTGRTGLIAQASYLFWTDGLEVAVRGERVDDNDNVQDVGDFDALAAGLHWYAAGLDLRFDLDWYHRIERFEPTLANDSVVLSTQGRF